jgi:hypothetical protein
MPSKVLVRLHFPSHDRVLQVKKKIALDGRYVDDTAKISVPLQAGMSTKTSEVNLPKDLMEGLARVLDRSTWAGDTIDIDAETGNQIRYVGRREHRLGDGRHEFASAVKKDARDLQTRGIQFDKFVWPVVIFVLGVMFALVAALAFSMKSHGG